MRLLAEIFVTVCALACALSFAYWYKRADREEVPDDPLPFQGRMILFVLIYAAAVITAFASGGIGLVATIATGTIAVLIVWAVVSKQLRREAKGPTKTFPLWIGVPLSGVWGLVPESWRCRHH